MKYRVFFELLLILFSFCLVSCSHHKKSISNFNDYDTIKQYIANKNEEISWATELEPYRLTTPVSINNISIAKEVETNPLMVISANCFSQKIYPELEGFTSLDLSAMDQNLYKYVDNFCNDFCKKNIFMNLKSSFNSKMSFNSYLFLQDFVQSYEKNLQKFPYDSSTSDEKIDLFKKYFIGQPVKTGEFFEIPVRFYCQSTFIDLTLNIKDENPYELYDIKIIGWEKNGE